MEDICFLELQPKIAGHMQKQFDACRSIDKTCLAQTRHFLLGACAQQGLVVDIDERIKGLYSTYRKMILKKRTFEEIADRLALRILVDTPDECYRVLGIVHANMHPILGKVKDYIGTPKENGYRSIHTVVYPLAGVSELPLEIQIRTHTMHHECEFGIASHADYKDCTYALTTKSARVNLFRNLDNLRALSNTPDAFERALQKSFRDDELLIFDPENTLYHIRPPATALDFACSSDLDPLSISGVRINGRKQPLSTLLHDGDTVEILRSGKPLQRDEYLKACHQSASKKLLKKLWSMD